MKQMLLIAAVLCSALVQAQSYPVKPIRVIIPLATGSPPEYALRVLATEMGKNLGQPLVIENRGGAGGTIGAAAAAKAADAPPPRTGSAGESAVFIGESRSDRSVRRAPLIRASTRRSPGERGV